MTRDEWRTLCRQMSALWRQELPMATEEAWYPYVADLDAPVVAKALDELAPSIDRLPSLAQIRDQTRAVLRRRPALAEPEVVDEEGRRHVQEMLRRLADYHAGRL